MFELLRSKCFFCHKLRGTQTENQLLVAQLELLDKGRLVEAKELREAVDKLVTDTGNEDLQSNYQQLLELVCGPSDSKPTSRPSTDVNCRSVREFRSKIVSDFFKRCTSTKTCPVSVTWLKSKLVNSVLKNC